MMTNLKLLLVVFVVIDETTQFPFDSKCPTKNAYCTCQSLASDKYAIKCLNNVKNIVLTIQSSDVLDVKCDETTRKFDFNVMEYIPVDLLNNAAIKSVHVTTCPEDFVKDLLNALTKLKIEKFNYEYASVSNVNDVLRVNSDALKSLKVGHFGTHDVTPLDIGFVYEFSDVMRLDLSRNGLVALPEDLFGGYLQLKHIYLNDNELTSVPEKLFYFNDQLTTIDLSNNKLTAIPDNVFINQLNVDTIHLQGNSIKHLPEYLLVNNVNLKTINFADNFIEMIPDNFFKSTPVINVNFNNNFITYLHNLFEHSDVREFDIRNNNVQVLPDDFFDKTLNMKSLDLAQNDLTRLPERIFAKMGHLQHLDLSGNRLRDIDARVFENQMKLITLNLNDNEILSFPSRTFKNLINLEELRVNHNYLTEIQHELLSENENIRVLDLNSNRIAFDNEHLISPFNNMLRLETLDLSHNHIHTLYDDWRYSLLQIKMLNLSHNEIKSIEFLDVWFLTDDLTVDLSHNTIETVDMGMAEVIAKGYSDIVDMYEKRHVLILNDNPIACNCSNYHLRRYFDGTIAPEAKKLLKIEANTFGSCSTEELVKENNLMTHRGSCNFLRRTPCSCKCGFVTRMNFL